MFSTELPLHRHALDGCTIELGGTFKQFSYPSEQVAAFL
jgi:hypothetical protein